MIYRDPRQSVKDQALNATVIYVFSLPDTDQARVWSKDLGMPRGWDEDRKRVRVYGRFIQHALKLPKASMRQVNEWQDQTDLKMVR